MPDDQSARGKPHVGEGRGFNTRMSHAGRAGTRTRGFVNPPLMRGSTVLSESCADYKARGATRLEQSLIYGVMGGPTHYALEDVVAEIEGGTRCQIVSSGLAAVTTPLLAYLGAGDHVLMPDSVYGPTRRFCDGMLARMGAATTYYAPSAGAAEVQALMQPNTKVLYVESPGSHTFEVQDVPALAAAAHAGGAKVLMDNTWGIHFFQPFQHGVDVSIQALTKYVAGHSDVLLGGITTARDEDWERVRMAALALGQYASPDDCWLALRGVRTMGVRLRQQMQSGVEVAEWFAARPEVSQVLHPALEGSPGHAHWRTLCTQSAGLFSIVFEVRYTARQVDAFVDALKLFKIGFSWAGPVSLVVPYDLSMMRKQPAWRGTLVRFSLGLEAVEDLIADSAQALAVLEG